jgi:hypothetical protein
MAGAMGKLEKAYLCEQNSSKRVEFQFNPESISYNFEAKYNRDSGVKKGPPPTFLGVLPITVSFRMLLDAVEDDDSSIDDKVKQLLDWTAPKKTNDGKAPSPPLVKFVWGALEIGRTVGFIGHIEKLSVEYTMFATDGTPLRAFASFSMTAPDAEQEAGEGATDGTNPTSGALRPQRLRELQGEESLQHVAYQEYGDAALWRELASANAIDDPLRLAAGLRLRVPTRDELDLASGTAEAS